MEQLWFNGKIPDYHPEYVGSNPTSCNYKYRRTNIVPEL